MKISSKKTRLKTNKTNTVYHPGGGGSKLKGKSLDWLQASSTLGQLSQMKAQNRRFARG